MPTCLSKFTHNIDNQTYTFENNSNPNNHVKRPSGKLKTKPNTKIYEAIDDFRLMAKMMAEQNKQLISTSTYWGGLPIITQKM